MVLGSRQDLIRILVNFSVAGGLADDAEKGGKDVAKGAEDATNMAKEYAALSIDATKKISKVLKDDKKLGTAEAGAGTENGLSHK